MAELSPGENVNDVIMEENIDLYRYSIFSTINNEDIFKYASERNAKNYYLFINPDNPEKGFPDIGPIQLARYFDSLFPDKEIFVRFNKNKALVFNTNNAQVVKDVLEKKEFLNTQVKISLATDNLITKILVKEVSTKNSITEVVEDIEFKNNIKILAAKRYFWKGNPTRSVLLTISGQYTPIELKCGYQNVPVEPFIEKPIQCLGCFHYGHFKNKCRAAQVCASCGCALEKTDEETKEVITHDETTCEKINCIHCEELHKSDNKSCSEYIKNVNIIKLSKQRNIPKFEARRVYHIEGKKPTFANIVCSRNDPQYNIDFPELISNLKADIRSEIKELFLEFKESQDKKIEEFTISQDKKLEEFKNLINQTTNSKEITPPINDLNLAQDKESLKKEITEDLNKKINYIWKKIDKQIDQRVAKAVDEWESDSDSDTESELQIQGTYKRKKKEAVVKKNEAIDDCKYTFMACKPTVNDVEALAVKDYWKGRMDKIHYDFQQEINSIDCINDTDKYQEIVTTYVTIYQLWYDECVAQFGGKHKCLDLFLSIHEKSKIIK